MARALVAKGLLLVSMLALAGCAVVGTEPPPEAPVLLVPYVGQGAGVAVVRAGTALLFDAGPESSAVLSGLLRDRGIAAARLLVVSHWDGDHVGGLDSLVAHGQIAEIVHGGEPADPWMKARKASWCRRIPAGCRDVAQGDGVEILDGMRLEVVRTDPEGATDNARGLVARLLDERGRGLVLAPGDVDTTAEASLLAAGRRIDATTILVGHHGSRGSSSLPFLGAIRPRVAFVQAGIGNSYGHPHADALERLRRVVPDVRRPLPGATDSVLLVAAP